MKQERKLSLLNCFPAISEMETVQMQGKGAKNFVVFLTQGSELFTRCYHRYSDGKITERQRYVFAKDGCVRYGFDDKKWTIRTEFREPVFCKCSMGYNFDNSYTVLNENAIEKSDLKYCQYQKYTGNLLMSYLGLYCRHKNLEYPIKQGYECAVIEVCTGFWGSINKLELSDKINWKSNNLLQMLNLNKVEFNLLKGNEYLYDYYISYREKYPKLKPQDILNIVKVFRYSQGTLDNIIKMTGLKPQRIARYLSENDIPLDDYLDYVEQCEKLEYNLYDTAFSMPHNFYVMHERLSQIIETQQNKIYEKSFRKNYQMRKNLEYRNKDFLIRQPENVSEIIDEGKALSHCVGGYAERHAKGKLHIMFLRKLSEPDKPYYTVEITTGGKIKQCRGYKNNVISNGGEEKPQEIKDFEKEYQQYLNKIFAGKKERKTA